MKKIKIINNPSSGRQGMDKRLDRIIHLLLRKGHILAYFETKKKGDALNETIKTCQEDWDLIIVAGGDGTINEVARGIVKGERKVPVAILASGTVNDFASHLRLPQRPEEFVKMVSDFKYKDVDLGRVGNQYFVNVAAGGFLTNVAYNASLESKMMIGRSAYYLEGLKELLTKGFEVTRMKIESDFFIGEEDVLLFLISNSGSIGGFKNIAPEADVTDGLMNVIIIKEDSLAELTSTFLNIFKGDHINNKSVLYFKTDEIRISADKDIIIDLDGEEGPKLPATFSVEKGAFRILISNEEIKWK